MPFLFHPYDVNAWYIYTLKFLNNEIDLSWAFSTNRPLWFILLFFISRLYGGLQSIININSYSISSMSSIYNPYSYIEYIPNPLYIFMIKMPLLLSDLLSTFLLHRIVNSYCNNKKTNQISAFYFINPMSIWISAVWGQYESLINLFVLLSIYFVVKNKPFISNISIIISALLKPYSIVVLIPLYFSLFKKRINTYYPAMIKILIFNVILLVIICVSYPSLLSHYYNFILMFFQSESYSDIFGFGISYWSISMVLNMSNIIWFNIEVVLIITSFIISINVLMKYKTNDLVEYISLNSFILVSGVYLSYRYIGETRFYFILPFICILISKKIIPFPKSIILSIIPLLYVQKNFPYYLLPLTYINSTFLEPLFTYTKAFRIVDNNFLIPSTTGAIILSILGILFSYYLFTLYLQCLNFYKNN